MSQDKEIQKVIEQILGSNIVLRYDGGDNEDKLKEEFIKVMTLYEKVWKRQNDLDIEHGIDFTTYDEPFFQVIEGLIRFSFDETAGDAIIFYIYLRKDDDGNVNSFEDPTGKEHVFNNYDDLWEFLLYWAEEMMKL